MYCPNCGTENKDTSKYCRGCGKRLKKMPVWSLVLGLILMLLGSIGATGPVIGPIITVIMVVVIYGTIKLVEKKASKNRN